MLTDSLKTECLWCLMMTNSSSFDTVTAVIITVTSQHIADWTVTFIYDKNSAVEWLTSSMITLSSVRHKSYDHNSAVECLTSSMMTLSSVCHKSYVSMSHATGHVQWTCQVWQFYKQVSEKCHGFVTLWLRPGIKRLTSSNCQPKRT